MDSDLLAAMRPRAAAVWRVRIRYASGDVLVESEHTSHASALNRYRAFCDCAKPGRAVELWGPGAMAPSKRYVRPAPLAVVRAIRRDGDVIEWTPEELERRARASA